MAHNPTWQWSEQTALLIGGRDSTFYFYSKRLMDVTLALLSLILLLPVMLIIAILIKLDTPGPVLFLHERVGSKRRSENGQTRWQVQNFQVCKFRTMVHNADQSLHQAYIKAFVEGRIEPTESGDKYKLTNDPRVTGIGHLLRKASLDELPQLINVLKGEMSLVGPRPVPPYEVAGYKAQHHERLATLPGITGLWQVKGRCQVTFEEMVCMDIEYVRSQSLWLDVKLLFMTIPAILSGRGAE